MKNGELAAMPITVGLKKSIGLTKREYFAAMAMQGIMASDFNGGVSVAECAGIAVNQADALLKALQETHETD